MSGAPRIERKPLAVPLGCWLLSVSLLCAVPVVAAVDPQAPQSGPGWGEPAWWWGAGVLTAQSAALAWRQARPRAVAVAVAVGVPVGAAVGMASALGLTSLALLVALFTLGLRLDLSGSKAVLGAAGLLVAIGHGAIAVRQGLSVLAAIAVGATQAVVLLAVAIAAALVVRARRDAREALADTHRALEREQQALTQAAVARERTAMARELHDIAAHHLTGIAVMSAAIATQIDTDPEAAKAAVADVRRQSTAVLRDLRSLVGLLRQHEDTPSPEEMDTQHLAGIPDLVGATAARGGRIELTELRSPGRPLGADVGPLAQLAGYRMIQESLANAARHAPGARCEVEVDDRAADAVVLTVRNEPSQVPPDPTARGGLGLVGMRERAELTGGSLTAGPTAAGGWEVRLRVPRAAAPRSPR